MEAIESILAGLKSQIEVQATQLETLTAILEALAKQVVELKTKFDKIRHSLPPWRPLDRFDLFPKLPIEIRLEIWRFALCVPCLVTLENSCEGRYDMVWIDRGKRSKLRGEDSSEILRYSEESSGIWIEENLSRAFTKLEELDLEIPPLFSTCRESRSIVLRNYAFCMSTANMTGLVIKNDAGLKETIPHEKLKQSGFRFLSSYDTVYLNLRGLYDATYLELSEPSELETETIKSLAIPYNIYEQLPMTNLFPGLEELIIIFEDMCEFLDCSDASCCSRGSIRERFTIGRKFSSASRQPFTLTMGEEELHEYLSSKAYTGAVRKPKFQPVTPLE